MGEKSKNSGEAGEKKAGELLKLFGWTTSPKGISLTCQIEGHEKKTHGIDSLFYIDSPLIDDTQENVIVSVKHREKYDSNASRKFKDFLIELANTMECFSFDDEYGTHVIRPTIDNYKTTGILIWLAYNEDDNKGVIDQLQDLRFRENIEYETVYLIDNNRASYLKRVINYARSFFNNSTVHFYYTKTGYNPSPINKEDHGLVMPVEYIGSNLIPFRIEENATKKAFLLLVVKDSFEQDNLKRLIGLCQSFTGSWASGVYISFPDYHKLKHESIVEKVKSYFTKPFADTITVTSYSDDLNTLEEE